MHTLRVIVAGLALLAVCLVAGRLIKTVWHGAAAFIPLWLIVSAINMWIGVSVAGYSVAAELPIFLIVFGVPALLAVWAMRVFR